MKISIITVCYNSAETIFDTIKSVTEQDYPDTEYIIVDGKSTDNTVEIINQYRSKVTTLISEADSGIYDAMNKGINAATGQVIATLNSDDIYACPNSVSMMAEFIQQNNLDAAYADLVYFNSEEPDKIVRYWNAGDYKTGAFYGGWVPPHPTFFCKKHIFQTLGTYNTNFKIAADFELMLRFIEKNKIKIAHLPKIITKMRTLGKANNIRGIIKGNREIIKSFKINNLRFPYEFFLKKPFLKIPQLLKRPALPEN